MDSGTLILIAAGCGILCIVLFVIGTVLNALGIVFELLGGLAEFAINMFNFGPVPGCGCVVVVGVIALCIGTVLAVNSVLQTCGTPQQVNFCQLLGY